MLKSYAVTHIGRRRKVNQDFVYTCEQPVGPLPNLFIIADGMGGHQAGDYASKLAAETIVEQIMKASCEFAVSEIIRMAIESANGRIRQAAGENSALAGMGTTAVVASFDGGCLTVGNVGDSKLYVCGEKLRQITIDHSLVEEMVRMGAITREQAYSHPDKNIITRAVGASDNVDVDLFTAQIGAGQTVLMCTDGLSNMVQEDEIFEIAGRNATLEERAQSLVDAANRNGGRDNIGVILIEPFAGE